jgi:hypothetical protein
VLAGGGPQVSRQSLCPHAHTTHKHCDAGVLRVVGNLRELGRRFTPCTRARSPQPCLRRQLHGIGAPCSACVAQALVSSTTNEYCLRCALLTGRPDGAVCANGLLRYPLRGSCVKLPYAALGRVQGSSIMRRGRPRCAGRRKCVGCSGVFGRSGGLSSSSSTHKLVVLRQAVAGQCTPPAKIYWAL